MKIHLPNSAFLGNIDPFLKNFDPENPNLLEIIANPKWISVHPVVLSMIVALGLKIDSSKIRCENFSAKSRHYLVRMGLFKILNINPEINFIEHESAGRFIPITQIRSSSEITRVITDMIPLLHLDPEPSKTIGYIVSELARNVVEHSGSKDGAIFCAQYYKKSNSIRIGIVDSGVGIKKTIAHSHPVKTDIEAIGLALTPGITGATRKEGGTEQNAGAGLFFIKSIANVNRDFFIIYSGKGFYKLLKKTHTKNMRLHADPFKDSHSKGEDYPYWQGTVVGIDISLDQTKELSLLLDSIRKTYTQAIRERKKARYRRPKFI